MRDHHKGQRGNGNGRQQERRQKMTRSSPNPTLEVVVMGCLFRKEKKIPSNGNEKTTQIWNKEGILGPRNLGSNPGLANCWSHNLNKPLHPAEPCMCDRDENAHLPQL